MLIPSPSLKAVILFKAINRNKPLTVILNFVRFIFVYRLGIVAKPDRVMMLVAENICELVRKDSQPPASSTDDKPRAKGKLAFIMPRCEGRKQ